MSFRDDGAAAVDWVASYLERVGELPVLAQVEPGELRSRLPAVAARDTPSRSRAILRDLDEVLLPAATHWQSPRFFAYFANTGSEPGILAELLAAGLNQVGILWRTSPLLQELEEVTLDWLAQLLGLPAGPARPPRGHRVDRDDGRARSGARGEAGRPLSSSARSTRTRRSRRRAGSSTSRRGRRRWTTPSGSAPMRSTSRTHAPSSPRSGRPRRARSTRSPRSPTRASATDVWLHVDAAYAGSAAVCPELRGRVRRLGARRLRRRQPAQVAADADGLLRALDASARRPPRRLQPRPGVPARQRGGREPLRVQPRARAPVPGAEALGGAPLLRARGACSCGSARRSRLAALFEGWVRDEPGWELAAPRPFSLVCFRREGSDEENEALLERVNATGEIFISHTKLNGRYTLRLAVGNARTTEADVRRAWDVLRREAG